MSRCFPYPPPGYTPALIESIGVVGKDKEKKKKRKREKKAKKIKTVHSKYDVIITKEEEEVERSGTTEEHGDPSNYSSDCSSGKRKRQEKRPKRDDHIPTSRDNLVEFRSTSVGRAGDDQTPTCPISRRYKELRKAAQQYRDLIENWNPPAFSMLMGTDCDDDDRLSATRKRAIPIPPAPEKTTSSCSSSSTLWPPRARFLPDANIYALPYVLPF